jgi:hypothetical protein
VTDAELAAIEAELSIRLPEAYRAVMAAYPIPACVGNDDTELWHNAPRLVELNKELRSGRYSIKPWPAHIYALGRDAGGCSQALNLQDSTVVWADRGHLPELPAGSSPFEEWCAQYLADLRSDLEGDGINADGSPESARQQMDANNRFGDRAFCGCILVLLVLLGVAILMRVRG